MEDIKVIARAAKQRLKSNFWDECKRSVEAGTNLAVQRGFNERNNLSKSTVKIPSFIISFISSNLTKIPFGSVILIQNSLGYSLFSFLIVCCHSWLLNGLSILYFLHTLHKIISFHIKRITVVIKNTFCKILCTL